MGLEVAAKTEFAAAFVCSITPRPSDDEANKGHVAIEGSHCDCGCNSKDNLIPCSTIAIRMIQQKMV